MVVAVTIRTEQVFKNPKRCHLS